MSSWLPPQGLARFLFLFLSIFAMDFCLLSIAIIILAILLLNSSSTPMSQIQRKKKRYRDEPYAAPPITQYSNVITSKTVLDNSLASLLCFFPMGQFFPGLRISINRAVLSWVKTFGFFFFTSAHTLRLSVNISLVL